MIPISIFEWDIAVLQNNKIFLIKNQKLLYQHSEITVLISLMTPYPSRSLFLNTGFRPCLVLLRMLPILCIFQDGDMSACVIPISCQLTQLYSCAIFHDLLIVNLLSMEI